MACPMASCMAQTQCSAAERVSSCYTASCSPTAARPPPRMLPMQQRRWITAAALQPQTLQRSAHRRLSGYSVGPMRQPEIVATQPYPDVPETEKERSPLDYPQEWITPQPSRRPDIFPEFDKQTTPMPKPMPGDPEIPDEDEEEEKKKEDPEKDPEKDPDKPQPEKPEKE